MSKYCIVKESYYFRGEFTEVYYVVSTNPIIRFVQLHMTLFLFTNHFHSIKDARDAKRRMEADKWSGNDRYEVIDR